MNVGKLLNSTGIILSLILFFALNLISQHTFRSIRLDLTQNHLHTLSAGTKHLLSELKEPIALKLYYSKKLATGSPNIQTYADRVMEVLEEYVRMSRGLIALNIIDPEPFSEAEDEALAAGLSALPVDSSGSSFYFGLVGSGSTDQSANIPFFQTERESFLEYDLSKLIYQLSVIKKPVMGILSAIPFGPAFSTKNGMQDQNAGSLYETLESLFDLHAIDPQDPAITSDISVLFAIRPEKFSPHALFALDQFIMKGGHALILTDPQAEDDQATTQASQHLDLLHQLYGSWGIQIALDKVVADLPTAKKVWFTPHGRPEVVDYPLWLDLNESYINQKEVITANLSPLVFSTAGEINVDPQKSTNIPDFSWTPLINSSKQAMLIPTADLQRYNMDPYALLHDYKKGNQAFVLAARVSGRFKTAFPNGAPKDNPNKNPDPSQSGSSNPIATPIKQAEKSAQIVLIADSDFIKDKFWLQTQAFLGQVFATPTAANGNLIVNALDNLTGNADLIAIRAQSEYSRPFTLIKALQQKAQNDFRVKEKELQAQLKQTEDNLKKLEDQKKDGNLMVLDADQRAEIERFRAQKIQIRSKLRGIQHALQQDINALENIIRLLDVYCFPMLIGLLGALYLWFRKKQLLKQAIHWSKRIAI